jgi:hypothetical protein
LRSALKQYENDRTLNNESQLSHQLGTEAFAEVPKSEENKQIRSKKAIGVETTEPDISKD